METRHSHSAKVSRCVAESKTLKILWAHGFKKTKIYENIR